MPKNVKRKRAAVDAGNQSDDEDAIPTVGDAQGNRQVVVLLDKAFLETTKTKRNDFELLNCDDHRHIARKHGLDPANYRPDILHQMLLALIDSPLNKAGHLKIFIHTEKHVLIEVNPKVRIPRTYKRFSGLMVQLLHKLKIRSATDSEVLLKVIKNPISRHLPPNCHAYAFEPSGDLYSPRAFAASLPDDGKPILLVLGATAAENVAVADHPYVQKLVSISEYPLSGACALSRLCGAIENQWGVV